MNKYEVTLRNKNSGERWSLFFDADDFSHAEEQAIDTGLIVPLFEEIIKIEKDY